LAILEYNPHTVAAVVVSPFIGSFLSAVVARLPAGESVVTGRSRCPDCGQALGLRDLVPILSWVFLRGRCRQCGAAIGRRYLVLELAALLVAVWAAAVVEGWLIWPSCLLGWALLTLAAIDLEHFILPNAVKGLGMGDAKLAAAAGAWTSWTGAPSVVLLACAAAFLFVLGRMLGGRPIGARDRLAFGPYLCLGLWLVWLYGPLKFGAM
jgi:leader peptidase (prepilin peptidase)/N-methyltransferase